VPVAEDPATLAEERLDQLLRLKADFENYRKRVIREQTDLVDRASLRIVERLLPVLDDLDRALRAAEEHQQLDAIVRGIELVQKQLHEALVEEGLERVMAEGPFDPHEHEAVSSMPGDVAEPTVLEVVRPGYKLKGKTIRPAMVHVSVPHALPSSEEGSE
jgi:molecular chaperone GrpE